jgi:CRP/FNR family transcriptional regulator, cyclic AMP receptor protein
MTSGAGSGTVVVLDCDPDLGQELSGQELSAARRNSLATTRRYDRGRWPAPTRTDANLGLLITGGFVARALSVGDCTGLELLGPGDVLQPWVRPELEQSVAVATEWTVIQRMVVANLDGEFVSRVSKWPQIVAAISRRLSLRTHSLLFQLTLAAFRRLDDRVLLVLWQFADRWGTVTPRGVMVDIPLTHELLAAAVGGRRPSVSGAVGRLVEQGQIRSLPRSRWLLLTPPPGDLHNHAKRTR